MTENRDLCTMDNFHIPRWNELPSVDLYMDQIITFISDGLYPLFHHGGAAPITKSMINNYVKSKIVDAPVNKKYPRRSVAMIIVVCILKSCFATDEIGKLIQLGLALENTEETYNRFCESIENAVKSVFAGELHIVDMKIDGRENKYLMESFAAAFACKFYVQKSFLE